MKQRAVFYARVSTEEEKQLNALEKQIQENKDIIAAKGWELVDSYIDEGKSGTTTKRRGEYQRLYNDMELDKFEIIVIKSQDRLQRNTFEWYRFADHLNKTGKRLYLYMDNKFFVPSEDALITGIKAILAEEYSRDLSKKLNNANKRRIEQARRGEKINAMGNGQTYGYTIRDKKWVIVPEEAEIVRKMFETYSEVHSLRKTRDKLNELGYRNKFGRLFTEEVIGRVLHNEMHKGWVVLNRHHRNFDTKEIIQKDESEWVIVENDHEPIVSPELWDAVNNEIKSHLNNGHGKNRGKKTGTDPLSGKMFCANCGKVLWKHTSVNKSGSYVQWYCGSTIGTGKVGCSIPSSISDKKVRKCLCSLADKYLDYSAIEYSKAILRRHTVKWLENLREYLRSPNLEDNERLEAEIAKLEAKKAKLLDAYTEELIGKEEFKDKRSEIDKAIESKRTLIVPAEESEDIADIDIAIRNIDKEIDKLFEDEAFLEENKISFILEHLKSIQVLKNGDICVILDKIAGAFLFMDGGKAEMFVSLEINDNPSDPDPENPTNGKRVEGYTGKAECIPFDRGSMPFPHRRICNEKNGH